MFVHSCLIEDNCLSELLTVCISALVVYNLPKMTSGAIQWQVFRNACLALLRD